jgi:hypothetical protein
MPGFERAIKRNTYDYYPEHLEPVGCLGCCRQLEHSCSANFLVVGGSRLRLQSSRAGDQAVEQDQGLHSRFTSQVVGLLLFPPKLVGGRAGDQAGYQFHDGLPLVRLSSAPFVMQVSFISDLALLVSDEVFSRLRIAP